VEYLNSLLYLCPLVFLAGFIDSSAGGGGVISIPAFMLTGMPAHLVFGTNKLTMSIGTAISAGRFLKNKAVDIRAALFTGVIALLGAALGSQLALLLSDRTFRIILIAALPCIAVFQALRRNKAIDEGAHESIPVMKRIALAALIGFSLGVYDGAIGPGTGTLAIIAFNAIMRYDLKTASGNAKILNLCSNIAALVTFALAGNVLFIIGLPAAVFSVAGNYLGAGFAIKKGAKFIRPMLFIVLAILLAKVVYDFVSIT